MKEVILLLNSIKIEMDDFYNHTLPLVEKELTLVINKIKNCTNVESASEFFNVLDAIKDSLATLYYQYNITLPDRLNNFMYEYDYWAGRGSAPLFNGRKEFFEEIKSYRFKL